MNLAETKGIILFAKNHKEKDKLVKIFTESAGKQMFYVRGAHRKNNPLTPAIQPYTEAVFIGNIRSEGLSFLNNAKDIHSFFNIQKDIFLAGYSSYILSLADAAIDDRIYDPSLYNFIHQALSLIDEGQDAEIVTNIFEIQLLHRFGVAPIWSHCVVCGNQQGKFDYSSKYSGVLCEKHWSMDERRYHADAKAIHFIRMFSQISYDKIASIHLKDETKQAIRAVVDQLYEEYVGLHLKSKKFIDEMGSWQNILKPKDSLEDENK